MQILSNLKTNYLADFELLARTGLDKINGRSLRDSQLENAEGLESERIQREIAQYQAADRAAHQHVEVQLEIAREYVNATSYTYEKAPDGKYYAVSGHVSFDLSPVPGDPQETLEKAEIVARAARAPRDPTSEDLAIAARASAIALDASLELATEHHSCLSSDRLASYEEPLFEETIGTVVSEFA